MSKSSFLFFALGVSLASSPLFAEEPAAKTERRVTLHGFLSASGTWNGNRPDSQTNQLRVFDTRSAEARFDVAEVVFQRAAGEKNQVGLRVDLTAGQSIPKIAAASGLFRDSATGEAENFDVQQAFVTWVAPAGRGLKIDAGKFVTHAGLELIEGYDGYNDQFSRSILFGYAIPFTHTGIRVSYSMSSAFAVTAMAVQGWDNVKDNNSSKTVGAQLALTPSARVSLYLNYLGGAERAGSRDFRHLGDIVAIVKPTDRLTLAVNGDWAIDRNARGANQDGEWNGVALSLRYAPTDAFAVGARWERFDDTHGLRTGVIQNVKEVTLTPEFRFAKGFVARVDLRVDWSNQPFFEATKRSASRNQPTLGLNVAYAF